MEYMGIMMLKHQLWGVKNIQTISQRESAISQMPATSAHQTQSFQRRVQVGIITCQVDL